MLAYWLITRAAHRHPRSPAEDYPGMRHP